MLVDYPVSMPCFVSSKIQVENRWPHPLISVFALCYQWLVKKLCTVMMMPLPKSATTTFLVEVAPQWMMNPCKQCMTMVMAQSKGAHYGR